MVDHCNLGNTHRLESQFIWTRNIEPGFDLCSAHMEAISDIPARLKHVLRGISLASRLAMVNRVSKKVQIQLLLIRVFQRSETKVRRERNRERELKEMWKPLHQFEGKGRMSGRREEDRRDVNGGGGGAFSPQLLPGKRMDHFCPLKR